jgi:hypothetical protein
MNERNDYITAILISSIIKIATLITNINTNTIITITSYTTIETMRCLKNLPVWVVIRLCTNDNNMTQYWNGVDSEVELNMDVIDDPLGEAKEIHKYVRTYGTPLYSLHCSKLIFCI